MPVFKQGIRTSTIAMLLAQTVMAEEVATPAPAATPATTPAVTDTAADNGKMTLRGQ